MKQFLNLFFIVMTIGPISMTHGDDFFDPTGHVGSSFGIGISSGGPGWHPTKLIDLTRDPRYNKLGTYFLADYQKDFFLVEGRYGFSSNLGIFATSSEYENQVSALLGVASPAGVLNASLLTGIGAVIGSTYGKLVNTASWNNTYEDKGYVVASIPLELNLSMLLWGWGFGLQYHGEVNPEFTSTGFYFFLRHQS